MLGCHSTFSSVCYYRFVCEFSSADAPEENSYIDDDEIPIYFSIISWLREKKGPFSHFREGEVKLRNKHYLLEVTWLVYLFVCLLKQC